MNNISDFQRISPEINIRDQKGKNYINIENVNEKSEILERLYQSLESDPDPDNQNKLEKIEEQLKLLEVRQIVRGFEGVQEAHVQEFLVGMDKVRYKNLPPLLDGLELMQSKNRCEALGVKLEDSLKSDFEELEKLDFSNLQDQDYEKRANKNNQIREALLQELENLVKIAPEELSESPLQNQSFQPRASITSEEFLKPVSKKGHFSAEDLKLMEILRSIESINYEEREGVLDGVPRAVDEEYAAKDVDTSTLPTSNEEKIEVGLFDVLQKDLKNLNSFFDKNNRENNKQAVNSILRKLNSMSLEKLEKDDQVKKDLQGLIENLKKMNLDPENYLSSEEGREFNNSHRERHHSLKTNMSSIIGAIGPSILEGAEVHQRKSLDLTKLQQKSGENKTDEKLINDCLNKLVKFENFLEDKEKEIKQQEISQMLHDIVPKVLKGYFSREQLDLIKEKLEKLEMLEREILSAEDLELMKILRGVEGINYKDKEEVLDNKTYREEEEVLGDQTPRVVGEEEHATKIVDTSTSSTSNKEKVEIGLFDILQKDLKNLNAFFNENNRENDKQAIDSIFGKLNSMNLEKLEKDDQVKKDLQVLIKNLKEMNLDPANYLSSEEGTEISNYRRERHHSLKTDLSSMIDAINSSIQEEGVGNQIKSLDFTKLQQKLGENKTDEKLINGCLKNLAEFENFLENKEKEIGQQEVGQMLRDIDPKVSKRGFTGEQLDLIKKTLEDALKQDELLKQNEPEKGEHVQRLEKQGRSRVQIGEMSNVQRLQNQRARSKSVGANVPKK